MTVITARIPAGQANRVSEPVVIRKCPQSGVVLVERNNKIEFLEAYGYADRDRHIRNAPDTRLEIASLTKPFVAAAILRLQEQESFAPGIGLTAIWEPSRRLKILPPSIISPSIGLDWL